MKWMILLLTVSFFGIACTDDVEMSEPLDAAKSMTKTTTTNVDSMMSKEMDKMKKKVVDKIPTPAKMPAMNDGTTMYVTPSLLNVRSGPGMSNGVTRTITFQSKVGVMSSSRGWSKIGDNEYVASQFLSSSMPSQVNDPVMSAPVQNIPVQNVPTQMEAPTNTPQ